MQFFKNNLDYQRIQRLKRIVIYASSLSIFAFFCINLFVLIWRAKFAKLQNKNLEKALEITALLFCMLVLCCELLQCLCLEKRQHKLQNIISNDSDNKDKRYALSSAHSLAKCSSALFVSASTIAVVVECLVVTQLCYDIGFDTMHKKLPIDAENFLYLVCGILVLVGLFLTLESAKRKSQEEKNNNTQVICAYAAILICSVSILGRVLKGLEATSYINMPKCKDGSLSIGIIIIAFACLAELTLHLYQNSAHFSAKKDSYTKNFSAESINHTSQIQFA